VVKGMSLELLVEIVHSGNLENWTPGALGIIRAVAGHSYRVRSGGVQRQLFLRGVISQ